MTFLSDVSILITLVFFTLSKSEWVKYKLHPLKELILVLYQKKTSIFEPVWYFSTQKCWISALFKSKSILMANVQYNKFLLKLLLLSTFVYNNNKNDFFEVFYIQSIAQSWMTHIIRKNQLNICIVAKRLNRQLLFKSHIHCASHILICNRINKNKKKTKNNNKTEIFLIRYKCNKHHKCQNYTKSLLLIFVIFCEQVERRLIYC